VNRREALQLLMGGAALQLVPFRLLAELRTARMLLDTQIVTRALDSQQHATVAAIADTIIPKTETSGAVDVGAAPFINLILTEWYTEEERSRFLNGLADVDVRTNALFKKKFVECSPAQRAQILTMLGEQMTKDAHAVRSRIPGYRGSPAKPNQNFYYMMRNLTLTAYYTSEEYAGKASGFQVNPDR
jgi:gluconate 2-dehydrogenase gamma chain